MSKSVDNATAQANLRRVVISSLMGAVIEWYDFFLYGVVAGLVFNKLFFPSFSSGVGTILAFATFAVGFVARPLGGFIFGHFGDKIGRKKMLILTLEIMGVATVLIGCIPSFDSIGIWAPILLVTCRLAQGIGLGGEWGGAVLMSYESAPADQRAFYASLPQIGMSLGLLLASGIVGFFSVVLTDEAFLNWGWRVAFLLGAIAGPMLMTMMSGHSVGFDSPIPELQEAPSLQPNSAVDRSTDVTATCRNGPTVRPGRPSCGSRFAGPLHHAAEGALQVFLVEHVRNQSHPRVNVRHLSIAGDDAGSFLPPVLECIERKKGVAGNIFAGSVDAEHAALLARLVLGQGAGAV